MRGEEDDRTPPSLSLYFCRVYDDVSVWQRTVRPLECSARVECVCARGLFNEQKSQRLVERWRVESLETWRVMTDDEMARPMEEESELNIPTDNVV